MEHHPTRLSPGTWHHRFMRLAREVAGWSKDPGRKVGAVIVSHDRRVLATGYNGLPAGLADTGDRLERPAKYALTIHAEMNAILQGSIHGARLRGSSIYTTFAPCQACSLAIAQVGFEQVVCPEFVLVDQAAEWTESQLAAVKVLDEAGIAVLRLTNPYGEA